MVFSLLVLVGIIVIKSIVIFKKSIENKFYLVPI